jgi:RHS repeat-associated protein
MHRPLTILAIAVAALGANGRAAAAGAEVSATVYVGRHFEVRDHEQPVKYAFNGETRVARLTGSLSSRQRLQRIRLHTGWNLIALAVTAPDLLAQCQPFPLGDGTTPLLLEIYRWQPSTAEYRAVTGGETVAAGTVLWWHARTNGVVAVLGDYLPPNAPNVPAGGGYVAGPGLEAWPMQLPPGVTVWKFDAAERRWQASFADGLAPFSAWPAQLAPGDAIYVHTADSVELTIPDPQLRILYYHPDHVGSTSVTTDGAGQLVEETAYYPFGVPRHQHRPREAQAHYGFTQKERDGESGLNYFEARHLSGKLARFLTFDPMVKRLEALDADELQAVLTQPAKLNPFAYALNNPTRYIDPDGRDVRPRPAELTPKPPAPELTLRIGPPSKLPGERPALSVSIERKGHTLSSGSASAPRLRHEPFDLQISRYTDKTSTELYKKSQRGEVIKTLTVILAGKDGKEFRIHLTDVYINSISVSRDGHHGKDVETLTVTPRSVKFEHPDQPPPEREPTEAGIRAWRIEP